MRGGESVVESDRKVDILCTSGPGAGAVVKSEARSALADIGRYY